MNPSQTGQNASSNSGKTSTHFYKPPYVGRFSKIAQSKLRQLIKRYCKADLDVTLVFSKSKLRNMFSVKDSVPQGLCSRVVYKFSCAGCNSRPLATFVHVFVSTSCWTSLRMFKGTCRACHDSCDTECFTILDSAASKFKIKIKEALHNKWESSILNEQLRHLDLSLSF